MFNDELLISDERMIEISLWLLWMLYFKYHNSIYIMDVYNIIKDECS